MGSYRELLFLTVWFKRQEAELSKVQILAQGLASTSHSDLSKQFKAYSEALFPWLATARSQTDEVLVEKMRKEVAKGVISFNEMSMKFISERASTMRLPSEFQERLRRFRETRARRAS